MYVLTYLQSLALCLRNDKIGAVATEYVFLLAFIVLGGMAGSMILGDEFSGYLREISAGLERGATEAPGIISAS